MKCAVAHLNFFSSSRTSLCWILWKALSSLNGTNTTMALVLPTCWYNKGTFDHPQDIDPGITV